MYGFPWTADSSTALFSVILIDTWVYTPFVLLLILAGLQGLPKSPYESAMIDGGSAWFTFKTLTLPLLKPVILITLIFRLCAAIQEFSIIYSTTKGGPGDTLMNLSLSAYRDAFTYSSIGKAVPQILVDVYKRQSLNMNANEVIANRAVEILGGRKGDYSIVNPNDHVNYGQSTNDVFPSCGRLTALKLLNRAKEQLERLYQALMEKAEAFDDVIKMGRTQLQDAVPIRLGQEFRAYATAIRRDITRFEHAKEEMSSLNLGGTAIGTGLNADVQYLQKVVKNIALVSGLDPVSYTHLDVYKRQAGSLQ